MSLKLSMAFHSAKNSVKGQNLKKKVDWLQASSIHVIRTCIEITRLQVVFPYLHDGNTVEPMHLSN